MDALSLHKELLRLRRGEELLASLYRNGEMKTPMHLSVGQEAISVGVVAALDLSKDIVTTHHRSHAAYLACNGSFEALTAELLGRESGCSKGRGGSVHLTSRKTGLLASSAILGEMVAVAVGCALAFQMDKKNSIAVVFFGEAVFEEGIIYESFNFASIKNLPVLFVCENNGYSTESPLKTRQPPNTSLCNRAFSFNIANQSIDGNDVQKVYESASKIVKYVRTGKPAFLECHTWRHLEHVGPNLDHEVGRTYRTKEEHEYWLERCPVKRSKKALLDAGHQEFALDAIDHDIQAELTEAALRAQAAPFPDRANLLENVW